MSNAVDARQSLRRPRKTTIIMRMNGSNRMRRGAVLATARIGWAALSSSALVAAEPSSDALDQVVVTAQTRAENQQDVPISLQAIDTRRLEQLQVSSFDGYAKYLPSLSTQNGGPSTEQLFIRGVTNGSDAGHAGSQALVSVYLDEIPITAIDNNVDVHIYDIARVEALAGPQGTLFGATALAGTVRIITNPPSTTGFSGGYDLTGNAFTAGHPGGKAEGFLNVPLSDYVALRIVGFAEHDGGYINNVAGPPETFPTSGIIRTNANLETKAFNPIDTIGTRAALEWEIGDRWTLTPAITAQRQDARGPFIFNPAFGDLNIARYLPDDNLDRWWLAAMTIRGKISGLDVTYATGFLHRTADNAFDYSDASYFNDLANPEFFGTNARDNKGALISPAILFVAGDRYSNLTQDLRLATPEDQGLRGVVGLFLQRQRDDIRFEQRVAGLADQYSIDNFPGVLELEAQHRIDRDRAVFTDWSFDLTTHLTASAGYRRFAFDNTVVGFSGYNGRPTFAGFTFPNGEQLCEPGTQTIGSPWPCVNVDSRATGSGGTHRLTLAYRVDRDRMMYATWSTGFRPGGVNLLRTASPYAPDHLTNFEIGWKTEWFDRRLRFNGALFLERWTDAQFALRGDENIVQITNVGRAEIKGVESDVAWRVADGLTLSGSITALDAKATTQVCAFVSPSGTCTEPSILHNPDGSILFAFSNSVQAPAGTRLPFSPRVKGNLIARYEFGLGPLDAHVQGAMVAQSDALPALAPSYNEQVGHQPGYASFDIAAGFGRQHWHAELFAQNVFDRRGQAGRYTECDPATCPYVYVLPTAPRLVGLTVSERF